MGNGFHDESENNVSGNFECNICLDTVQDPVVTLCGHLYCWPCIYRWIQCQVTSPPTLERESAQCPICKMQISEREVVPLYGPSHIQVTEENDRRAGEAIPPRPPTPRYRGVSGGGGYRRLAPSPVALPGRGEVGVVVPSPTIGMLGEMVSGRIMGDLGSPLFGTPDSYNIVTGRTRRERLRTAETDRSLSRMCSFFIYGIIFCLLVFT